MILLLYHLINGFLCCSDLEQQTQQIQVFIYAALGSKDKLKFFKLFILPVDSIPTFPLSLVASLEMRCCYVTRATLLKLDLGYI